MNEPIDSPNLQREDDRKSQPISLLLQGASIVLYAMEVQSFMIKLHNLGDRHEHPNLQRHHP